MTSLRACLCLAVLIAALPIIVLGVSLLMLAEWFDQDRVRRVMS